ncbi:hypothetical protein HIM_01691 [Hirsutella minnesotensis 3608]|nr:hypothetical protein HIM_01691 [Hirsutella minnesotensis 3608]
MPSPRPRPTTEQARSSKNTGHNSSTPRRALPSLCASIALVTTLFTGSCAALAIQDATTLKLRSSVTITAPHAPSPSPAASELSTDETDPDHQLFLRKEAGRSSTTMTVIVTQAAASAQSSPSPLPSPFDDPQPSLFQGVGSDDSCPRFMSSLLADPTFKSCYPLSMLLQTSTGFFEAQKQLPSIVNVLDAACRANASSCTDFLNQAADNLTSSANCKAEIDQSHARVLQAWRGLKAYRTLYTASCLQDPSSNQYCFANSASNLNNPSDSYLYFMPFGLALPGASNPSCDFCTKETMKVFQAASANRQEFVASKYEDAAHQINVICGPDFVNSTLPLAEAAAANYPPPILTVFISIMTLFFTLSVL